MHPSIRIYIFGLFIILSGSVIGQNFEYPWALSAGANTISYLPHPGNPSLHESLFNVGYQIGVQKYVNSAFDFRAQLTLAPSVRFPLGIITRQTSPLVDFQYRLSFKLNNGLFFKENGLLGPFLSVGLGGSYVNNHPDAYLPLGGGVRIKFNQRMAIRLETTRNISVNKDYQSLNHALAFIYNLDTKESQIELDPQEIKDIESVASLIPPDTDNDGLVDSQDECPEVAGPLGMNGCPTKDFTTMDTEVVVVDESGKKEENEVMLDKEVFSKATTKNIPPPSPNNIDLKEDKQINKTTDIVLGINEQDKTNKKSKKKASKSPCGQVIEEQRISTILFGFGSDRISEKGLKQLDKIADAMNSCSETKLVLSGHTDDKGSEKDNLVLSVKRAFNVKYYLVNKHNISQFRITSDGLGEEKPLAENSTPNGREKNRRVDMKFIF